MESNIVRVVARLVAREGRGDDLQRVLEGLLTPTRSEPGCIHYELWRNAADSNEFTFIEEWRSPEDLAAHFETPHIREVLAKAPELLGAELDLRQYRLIG